MKSMTSHCAAVSNSITPNEGHDEVDSFASVNEVPCLDGRLFLEVESRVGLFGLLIFLIVSEF
jgi:hypothetical protein